MKRDDFFKKHNIKNLQVAFWNPETTKVDKTPEWLDFDEDDDFENPVMWHIGTSTPTTFAFKIEFNK